MSAVSKSGRPSVPGHIQLTLDILHLAQRMGCPIDRFGNSHYPLLGLAQA